MTWALFIDLQLNRNPYTEKSETQIIGIKFQLRPQVRPQPFTPGMAKQQPACVVESSSQKLGLAFFLMRFEDQPPNQLRRLPSKPAYQLELLHH